MKSEISELSVTGVATEQRRLYEEAYRNVDDRHGMPDRKIADGVHPVGKRILCLGCGTGSDIWYLVPGNEVVGVDYASSASRIAEGRGIRWVSADLNTNPTLPFEDESFDIVICKDILEHILEPILVMREVRRVLRRDGYVVVSVPNHFVLPMRVRMLLGKGIVFDSLLGGHAEEYEEWNYMHIRFFTFKGFRRFLEAAELKAEKWFWDFGNLAHYRNPDMWIEPQLWKRSMGLPLSPRARFGVYVVRPLWRAFNLLFPRSVRRRLVGVAPGLLCGGFYARCRKVC